MNNYSVVVLQLSSWAQVSDNSGLKWLRLFNIYKWGLNKRGSGGYYIYGSLRILSQLENLRRSKYKMSRGQRIHGMIVRARRSLLRLDGSTVSCWDNGVITFSRGFKPRGMKFYGPALLESGRLKVWTFFKTIV